MVIIAGASTTPRTNTYIHHKTTATALKSLVDTSADCCWCSCDTVIPQFVYEDDPNDYNKNDWYSWILKTLDNCTVVATLTKIETGTQYIITNNTLGVFYDVDVLKPNVWGFIIEWQKVQALYGYGNYQLNITVENSGNTVIMNKDYPVFNVMPYTCDSAHNTVTIETHNTGYIEGGFDYRDISTIGLTGQLLRSYPYWRQRIRWYGRVDVVNLPVQIDNISDNYRNLLQVQTQIEKEYNLRLEFIKADISNQIIFDNLLGDYIILSDFNANNVDDYKQIKTSLVSIDSPQPFKNRTVLYNIKFVPFKQNNLKRFY